MNQRAFTLMEMALVLTIIAFIVGAITAGKSLLVGTQQRGAVLAAQDLARATHLFNQKYFALPGDFNNAIATWGSDTTCFGGTNTTPRQGTCSGNGDGRIGTATLSSLSTENFRFFQHLANDRLIEGTYSGTANSGSTGFTTPGLNVPKLSTEKATLMPKYIGTQDSGSLYFFEGDYGHAIAVGAPATAAPLFENGLNLWLTAVEAEKLDAKFDDGKPGTGSLFNMVKGSPYATNCTGNESPTETLTATYSNDASTINCALYIKTGL